MPRYQGYIIKKEYFRIEVDADSFEEAMDNAWDADLWDDPVDTDWEVSGIEEIKDGQA
jgi:hypothetical protein